MGAIATFNFQTWVTRYPEFKYVDANIAEAYWDEATLYHTNDGSGPVRHETQQALLLNMLTAHIAQLYKVRDGQPVSDLVGRIDSASEGSVSVSAEYDLPPGTSQWYKQTKYGISYWNATIAFRTMQYRPAPRRIFELPFGGGGIFGR